MLQAQASGCKPYLPFRIAKRFTKADPCPLCRKDGCSVTDDGLQLCLRTREGDEDPWEWGCLGQSRDGVWGRFRRKGDSRWRDRASDHQDRIDRKAGDARATPREANPPKQPNVYAPFVSNAVPLDRGTASKLSEKLDLPAFVFDVLPVLFLKKGLYGRWYHLFPERDGDGVCTCHSFRDAHGQKRASGPRGLTIPRGWLQAGGSGPILLPEGASDTLALTAMGLSAVGRPSNTGGTDHLARLLSAATASGALSSDRPIIVLGENDRKETGQWPGMEGARSIADKLAQRLGRPVQVALPLAGVKDAREWVKRQGVDRTNESPEAWRALAPAFLAGLQFFEPAIPGAAAAAPDLSDLDQPASPADQAERAAEQATRFIPICQAVNGDGAALPPPPWMRPIGQRARTYRELLDRLKQLLPKGWQKDHPPSPECGKSRGTSVPQIETFVNGKPTWTPDFDSGIVNDFCNRCKNRRTCGKCCYLYGWIHKAHFLNVLPQYEEIFVATVNIGHGPKSKAYRAIRTRITRLGGEFRYVRRPPDLARLERPFEIEIEGTANESDFWIDVFSNVDFADRRHGATCYKVQTVALTGREAAARAYKAVGELPQGYKRPIDGSHGWKLPPKAPTIGACWGENVPDEKREEYWDAIGATLLSGSQADPANDAMHIERRLLPDGQRDSFCFSVHKIWVRYISALGGAADLPDRIDLNEPPPHRVCDIAKTAKRGKKGRDALQPAACDVPDTPDYEGLA